MKKTLMFLVVAVLAVASQGATIKWSSGAMKTAVDQEGTWGTQRAKGAVTATYMLVSQDVYNLYKDAGTTLEASKGLYKAFKENKISFDEKGQVTSNGGGMTYWTGNKDFAEGEYGYALAIYEYTSPEFGDFYLAASGYDQVNALNAASGIASGNLAVNAATANGNKWIPVPEPTTAALLALGLAAFGLKRKVRA